MAPHLPNNNPKTYAPLADELNPPFSHTHQVPEIAKNGTIIYSKRIPSSSTYNGEDDDSILTERENGDISQFEREPPRGEGSRYRSESEETLSPLPLAGLGLDGSEGRRRKGKGKEREWDTERGEGEREMNGVYPPVQEEEEEEKRVQEKLAMFAARDMARRRAARMSRQLPPSPMSTTSARRPLSGMSGGGGQRGSLMGIVGGIWGGTKRDSSHSEGELPFTSPRQQYTNPYDNPVPSPTPNSPFADPIPPSNPRRTSSHSSTQSDVGFTYSGPTYLRNSDDLDNNSAPGGTGAGGRRRGRERWWHALCAWGEELDDGDDGQAGRTNPFE